METLPLGRTGLMVGRTSFGALPIQRVSKADAVKILRKALDKGINLFDTARSYTDSEEKIGEALSKHRDKFILATKSPSPDKNGLLKDLETSLRLLKTNHVDILQPHNPATLPDPSDPASSYAGLLEAKRKGMIRFIGITTHKHAYAMQIIRSGLYDTVQYPLSAISSELDLEVIDACRQHNVGLIAMKPLCGGLLTNIPLAFAFFRQFNNIAPIWGIQRETELDQLLGLEARPPELTPAMRASIAQERAALGSEFCRGCGYCLPCPADIPINMAARMKFLLRRAPTEGFLTPDWQEKMNRIEKCINCGHCREHCPYHLDTPRLLRENLVDYKTFLNPDRPAGT